MVRSAARLESLVGIFGIRRFAGLDVLGLRMMATLRQLDRCGEMFFICLSCLLVSVLCCGCLVGLNAL